MTPYTCPGAEHRHKAKQINKEIEMSLGGFQRSQGLPLIQKKIDPEMINENLLLIEYFDFDVY